MMNVMGTESGQFPFLFWDDLGTVGIPDTVTGAAYSYDNYLATIVGVLIGPPGYMVPGATVKIGVRLWLRGQWYYCYYEDGDLLELHAEIGNKAEVILRIQEILDGRYNEAPVG